MSLKSILVAAALISTAAGAHATATLTGTLTADNAFNAYLSTSPGTLGTEIASGTNWQSVQTLAAQTLTPGTTYYLQIVAWNYDNSATPGTIAGANLPGNPDAFIGSFSLIGTGFEFANGGTSLNTDTADWQSAVVASPSYDTSNWSAPGGTPVSFATNGDTSSIWYGADGGPLAGISSTAEYIWGSAPATDTGESFFSTEIRASALPEPAAWALMMVGVGAMGAMLRRRPAAAPALQRASRRRRV